jgi:hypothetical protein
MKSMGSPTCRRGWSLEVLLGCSDHAERGHRRLEGRLSSTEAGQRSVRLRSAAAPGGGDGCSIQPRRTRQRQARHRAHGGAVGAPRGAAEVAVANATGGGAAVQACARSRTTKSPGLKASGSGTCRPLDSEAPPPGYHTRTRPKKDRNRTLKIGRRVRFLQGAGGPPPGHINLLASYSGMPNKPTASMMQAPASGVPTPRAASRVRPLTSGPRSVKERHARGASSLRDATHLRRRATWRRGGRRCWPPSGRRPCRPTAPPRSRRSSCAGFRCRCRPAFNGTSRQKRRKSKHCQPRIVCPCFSRIAPFMWDGCGSSYSLLLHKNAPRRQTDVPPDPKLRTRIARLCGAIDVVVAVIHAEIGKAVGDHPLDRTLSRRPLRLPRQSLATHAAGIAASQRDRYENTSTIKKRRHSMAPCEAAQPTTAVSKSRALPLRTSHRRRAGQTRAVLWARLHERRTKAWRCDSPPTTAPAPLPRSTNRPSSAYGSEPGWRSQP